MCRRDVVKHYICIIWFSMSLALIELKMPIKIENKNCQNRFGG